MINIEYFLAFIIILKSIIGQEKNLKQDVSSYFGYLLDFVATGVSQADTYVVYTWALKTAVSLVSFQSQL